MIVLEYCMTCQTVRNPYSEDNRCPVCRAPLTRFVPEKTKREEIDAREYPPWILLDQELRKVGKQIDDQIKLHESVVAVRFRGIESDQKEMSSRLKDMENRVTDIRNRVTDLEWKKV